MAVRFDEKKNLFTLQTLDSTYQMKVDDHGVLLHTYAGAPADETDFSYLIGPEDRGFSGQPGDEKKDRTYSMDYYPLEYPVQGNGDFRVKALKAGVEGAVPALDLRFISEELDKGRDFENHAEGPSGRDLCDTFLWRFREEKCHHPGCLH